MSANRRSSDVLIIGGGIVGCAAALHLARANRSVLVLERETAGSKASAVNFGGVRQNGRDLRELPIAMRAAHIWPRIHEWIGIDGEFRQTGNLRLCRPDTVKSLEAFHQGAAALGLALELLDRPALRRRYPWIGAELEAGLLCPTDGHANPRMVAPAFAHAAVEAGAAFVEDCAAIAGGHDGSQFVIETADNREFAADILINAAGAWGGRVARWFDEPVDIRPEVPQILVTEAAPYEIEPVLGFVGGDLYLRQTLRGNILFGGGEGRANDDWTRSRPLPETACAAASRALRLVPGLRRLSIIRSWSGVDGDTPDGVGIVGPSACREGLFHGFAFNGHGFQIGPAVGAILSELILDGRTETDISGLGIGRFRSPIDKPV